MLLQRSAEVLADLPIIEALMTSGDEATIQDASAGVWKRIGGDLFVLADRQGKLMALHTADPGLTPSQAQQMLERSLRAERRVIGGSAGAICTKCSCGQFILEGLPTAQNSAFSC